MDLVSVSTLLGSIKTATEIAKLIKDSDVSFEKAESKLRLAELISALADAKIEAAEIQQTLLEKDAAFRELVDRMKLKESLIWEQPYYWSLGSESKDGPFCQCCYDGKSKLVRLQGNGRGFWQCKVCSSNYTDKNYVEPSVVSYGSPFDDF